QRRHWHALGYTDDQIACYWARPAAEAYEADIEQYQRLMPDIAECYPARSGLLLAHLQQLANKPPPWLYIYITSHGRATMLPKAIDPIGLEPAEARLLDQHFIQMGSDPGEGADPRAVVEGYRNGVPEASLMLTPTSLADALRAFPAATTKYVMLQACHGGGFISVDDPEDRVARLLGVPNLVAIAAARHDRPSFGCEPGSTMTYFGEIFFRLLSEQFPAPPDAVDWEKFYEQLWKQVEGLERQQGVPASMPVLAISG
ncbi:MAG: C13 family peptidase, partial [Nannocystaceae bacterium]